MTYTTTLLATAGITLLVLLVVFLGVYTIRFPWEKSGVGRALVAAGSAVLLTALGDLSDNSGGSFTGIGIILTILGSLWLSTVLVWAIVVVIKGGFRHLPAVPPVATPDTEAEES